MQKIRLALASLLGRLRGEAPAAFFVGTGIVILLILFMVAMVQQPSRRAARPAHTVGVVLKAMDSEHWQAVRAGLEEAARSENLRLIVMTPENEAAHAEQNQIIADMLAGGVDALVVAPVNSHYTAGWAEQAAARDIPLLTIDEHVGGLPYVGSDNYHVGELAAARLAAALPAGAPVAVIAGSSSQEAHVERTRGFHDYIAAHTELVPVMTLADDTKYRLATSECEQILAAHPEVQGLFVTSAVMTLGALDVVERRGTRLAIVGVDTQADTLAALASGRLTAMISQDGRELGRQTIALVARELAGESIPAENFIENVVIDETSAARYLHRED